MKKLLMLGAILALGTTIAYGAELPVTDSTDVKVRAEITDDTLVITDLNGNPIVLDFGKISNNSTGIHNAEVGYKVTWGTNATVDGQKLTMELGGQGTVGEGTGAKTVRIYYNYDNKAGVTEDQKEYSFNTVVGLDKYDFDLKDANNIKDESNVVGGEYIGKVVGSINASSASPTINGTTSGQFKQLKTGEYTGETTLTVTLASK